MSASTVAEVVTAMTTNLTPSSLYDTYIALLPWIGTMAAACLTIYIVRKLVKKFAKGRVG